MNAAGKSVVKIMKGLSMTVAEWLASLPNVHHVRPVQVIIGKNTYPGAYAERTDHYQAGMDCVTRGPGLVSNVQLL